MFFNVLNRLVFGGSVMEQPICSQSAITLADCQFGDLFEPDRSVSAILSWVRERFSLPVVAEMVLAKIR